MAHTVARYILAALIALLALLAPALALAHGGHTGPSQTFTQELGAYEVAITVEVPPGAPAPLYLNIAPQDDMAGTTMRFRAAPRGQSFDGAPEAQLQGMAGPQGIYYTELAVDRLGDWEIEARVDGPRGGGVARIPFSITVAPLPAGSIGLFVALGGLVLTMLASMGLSALGRRGAHRLPGWLSWAVGQAMFACLIAAAIFGAQQLIPMIQGAQATADPATLPAGRPHANLALHTTPALPQAGQPITLTLDLSDGSTGLPIEDLVTHHDALLHLIVISQDGGFYHHTHPPRSAPGRYTIAITPDRAGRYTAYAEIERRDSGTQVITRDFVVGGAAASAPQFQGAGPRTIGDLQVDVELSSAAPAAGKQVTFTFSFSRNGKPVDDMQPWLGMGGHLIARSDDGALFAHVHALGPMAPAGLLATGYNYGPDLRFVYTFPEPGHYQIWGQFRHNGQVITVPLAIDVT
ncbi:MAG: hypothetical protein IPP13_10430 [Kouleothrix sp.]|jgi:hypothetical protein|nr:hypothetical protein [Kouleothrix sp.]